MRCNSSPIHKILIKFTKFNRTQTDSTQPHAVSCEFLREHRSQDLQSKHVVDSGTLCSQYYFVLWQKYLAQYIYFYISIFFFNFYCHFCSSKIVHRKSTRLRPTRMLDRHLRHARNYLQVLARLTGSRTKAFTVMKCFAPFTFFF